MNNSYVYTLADPRNGMPFYVGKGVGKRCEFHVDEAKYYLNRKSKKLNKLRKLLSLDLLPIITKIEEGVSDAQSIEFEMFVIAEMRDLGIPLTNMTDGGDGAKGYKHTEAHKEHISSVHKGRVFSEETKLKMRKPKSEEGKKNMAEARKSSTYKPSEETKQKTSNALIGRLFSKDHKSKISAALSGKQKPKTECPHCHKLASAAMASRWHFDNCKSKEQNVK